MTEFNKRGSMNTSMKNANIFYDSEESADSMVTSIKTEPGTSSVNIKLEKLSPSPFKRDLNDPEDSNSPFNKKLFDNFHIKQEDSPVKSMKVEKSDGNGIFTRRSERTKLRNFNGKEEKPKNFNEREEKASTELFTRRPVKSRLGPPLNNDSRKSVKRTVFTRDSPYKREVEEKSQNRPFRRTLSETGSEDSKEDEPKRKRKKPVELETDPVTLARRQKQIDFGKNTLGYDNYKKLVPIDKRASDDPQTPNKLIKYSRRGWDGLIKQWRLRIHKYDPVESD